MAISFSYYQWKNNVAELGSKAAHCCFIFVPQQVKYLDETAEDLVLLLMKDEGWKERFQSTFCNMLHIKWEETAENALRSKALAVILSG